jgi:hypothetical protein
MRFSVRTLQVPTRWGMGAFSPGQTWTPTAATNGQNQVSGAPGTVRIPSPRPAALNDEELGGPYNQPSSVAPDWFLPSIYTGHANSTLHFPGRVFGDNVLPHPVPNQGRSAIQTQHRFRIGGRTATSAMRPFTQWPVYSGGTN